MPAGAKSANAQSGEFYINTLAFIVLHYHLVTQNAFLRYTGACNVSDNALEVFIASLLCQKKSNNKVSLPCITVQHVKKSLYNKYKVPSL